MNSTATPQAGQRVGMSTRRTATEIENPNLFSIGEGFGFFVFFNDPLGYADLILNGDPEEYLKNVAGSHGLED